MQRLPGALESPAEESPKIHLSPRPFGHILGSLEWPGSPRALERAYASSSTSAAKHHLGNTLVVPQIHLLKDSCQQTNKQMGGRKGGFPVNSNILKVLLVIKI